MGIFISFAIMTFFSYILLATLGLIIGSFLNVATLRYDPDKGFLNMRSFGGRSHCPQCRMQLAWYELIPVLSYLFLWGQCRHCKRHISLQYPIVELLTAIVFVTVPMRIGAMAYMLFPNGIALLSLVHLAVSALWIAIFTLFIVLAVIDLRHMIIPDFVTITLAAIGIALAGVMQWLGGFSLLHGSFMGHYAMIFGFRESIWVNHFFAAFVGLIFFGLIIGLSRGRAMGWGDLKLAGALGLIFGWPDIVLVLMLSFIIGSIISVGLMVRGRKTMGDAVPFGPFLVIGAATVFFFGFRIMSLYFGSFGVV